MRIISFEELVKELDKYNYHEFHLHHTWKPTHKNFNGKNHIAVQEGMRNYHVNVNGWNDIAQHISIFPDGTYVTGRRFNSQPASISNMNSKNGVIVFMCEMIGNFDKPGTGSYNNLGYDKLEGAQLESAIKLARYFHKKGKYIRFHRENSPKTCPGTSIDKDEFMYQVQREEIYVPENNNEQVLSDWAKDAHEFVVKSGLSDGLRPKDIATREEIWTMLHRYSQNIKK